MNTTLKILLILLTATLIPVSCGENTTEPDNDGGVPTVYGGLLYDYEEETPNASTATVSPALGGTIAATGSNGVEYSLEVPPGAVASNQTITVTPLAELSITSMDSTIRETSDCLQGVLFAPGGLEFAVPAVLTITLPASGVDCQLSADHGIILFDDTPFCAIAPTEVDPGARTLTCSLSHFSGAAVYDMSDYEFLKYQIVETSKWGQGFPGISILGKLLGYAEEAADNGWDDLVQLAVEGARPILRKLADPAIRSAGLDPSVSMMLVLLKYTDIADFWGFDDIEIDLRVAMDALVRAYGSRGASECAAQRYSAGKAMIRQAQDWAMSGLLLTGLDDFLQQVDDWLENCGELNISLSASTDEVFNIAVDEGSIGACLVNFTVSVTTSGGAAVADKSVTIRWTRDYSRFTHGTTDAAGNFSATWSGAMILPTGSCTGIITEGFYAETANNTELFKSSVIPVTARALPVESSITYNYDFSAPENTASASIMGAGTGFCTGGPSFVCSEFFARTYNRSANNGYSTVTVDPDTLLMPACKGSIDYEIATDPGSGLTVPYVASITVREISKIFTDLYATRCTDGVCTTSGFWIQTCTITEPFNCIGMSRVYVPGFPGDGLTFLNKGKGAFDPYLWEYTDPNGYGSATLAVTVGLDP